MRTKVTLALIFLNVALFFFIFKFERNWRTEASSVEARRRVLGPQAANIRSLEVNRTTGGAFSLVRNRDAWFLSKPLDWPANPHAVNSILTALQLLEHETSFKVADLAKTSQSLADYGLDNPKMTVSFVPGDAAGRSPPPPATVLRIGDLTKDGKRLYVLSTDGERVHVVGRTLVDTLSFPLEQLRADTLLTIPVYEARSLGVIAASPDQNRGASPTGVRTRIRREGANWNFETPIIARASKTAVDLAINDLNALHPRTFNPPPSATPVTDAPELRITLDGNNRHETLLLREPIAPPANRPATASDLVEYRAELEGRTAQFTVPVPVRLLNTLKNAQDNLREKRILDDLDTSAITAITLVAPLFSTPSLTLQRLDATAGGSNAAPQWQIIQRSGDNQAPRPLPADRGAVQSLLERLTLLSAEKFKSDAPTSADLEEWGFNRAEREVTLTFGGGKPPTILRFGRDALTHSTVYARVGTQADHGSSIYIVNIDLRRELPIEVADWRDRTLREMLPAGVRFTSLKITDLASKRTVFETALGPAGEPSNPPREPKALPDILTQLRTLRAKRVLPAGFGDQVSVGGEERPWRYQLEASIALPARTGAEAPNTMILFFTERIGGTQQYGGSRELDVIFELEQPLLDALWSLVANDPGPPAAAKG